jgi:hypothetical protein
MEYLYFSKEEAGHEVGIKVSSIIAIEDTPTGFIFYLTEGDPLRKENKIFIVCEKEYLSLFYLMDFIRLNNFCSTGALRINKKYIEKVQAKEFRNVKEATFISVKHMITSFVVLETVKEVIKLLNR